MTKEIVTFEANPEEYNPDLDIGTNSFADNPGTPVSQSGGIPITSDDMVFGLWLALMALSVVCLILLQRALSARKRGRIDEEGGAE
jgi:hypothetical protein